MPVKVRPASNRRAMHPLAEEAPMATHPYPHRFTVHDYHRMAEAGILTEDDRVELIDGEIVEMSPIGWQHALCVTLLTQLLSTHLGVDALVSVQNPVRLSEHHEPEPDISVLKPDYGSRTPAPDDLILLMEVVDTALSYDRGRKLPLYARAGIPEAWIVDLQVEALERHTDPSGGAYRITMRVGRGKEIESLALPGLVLRVDEVVPLARE
jgi:Uma2 family endonuclease